MVVLVALLHPRIGAHQGVHLPAVSHHLHARVGTESLLGRACYCHHQQPLGCRHHLHLLHPLAGYLGRIRGCIVLSKPERVVGKHRVRPPYPQ